MGKSIYQKGCLNIQYLGGKSRISKEISEVINIEVSRRKIENSKRNIVGNRERERECKLSFVSLFCGTCSVESKVRGFDEIICNDNHEYLIEMLKGVQNGYELPENISENQYKYIRDNKDEDRVLTGFVGFGCSFGGKWFGGYARNKTNTNYASQSKRSLLKDMSNLENAKFICKDYRDVHIPKNSIIYADPPYQNTTGYGKIKFNTGDFWEYMRKLSETNTVFISEQVAPDDFIPIWEKTFTRTLDVNKQNQFKVSEKLFVHKSRANKTQIN